MDEQNKFNSDEQNQFQEQSNERAEQAPQDDYQGPFNSYQAQPQPPKSPKKRGGIGVAAVICIIIGSLIIGSVLGVSG